MKQAELISKLIEQTHVGLVFGPDRAFGAIDSDRVQAIARQAQVIAISMSERLGRCLTQALPEMQPADIQQMLGEVAPKTAVFVPALTAGELTGEVSQQKLALSAVAVGCMYLADQLTDRGDRAMLEAIEAFCSGKPVVPGNPRLAILQEMQTAIYELALEQDAPVVLECFDQKVLANEARLHRLSSEFASLTIHGQDAFLDQHAAHIAELMVEDAGFQSVTSSLYAIYRQNDSSLPPLAEIHADPYISHLLQVCNAAARVADEYGDWWMDAGSDPKYGVFSINPFNQYHPLMVGKLCELAAINDETEVRLVQREFVRFHISEVQRVTSGTYVTERFFNQMRRAVDGHYAGSERRYDKYVELCMRVGEISYVNMMGDIQLARATASEA